MHNFFLIFHAFHAFQKRSEIRPLKSGNTIGGVRFRKDDTRKGNRYLEMLSKTRIPGGGEGREGGGGGGEVRLRSKKTRFIASPKCGAWLVDTKLQLSFLSKTLLKRWPSFGN